MKFQVWRCDGMAVIINSAFSPATGRTCRSIYHLIYLPYQFPATNAVAAPPFGEAFQLQEPEYTEMGCRATLQTNKSSILKLITQEEGYGPQGHINMKRIAVELKSHA